MSHTIHRRTRAFSPLKNIEEGEIMAVPAVVLLTLDEVADRLRKSPAQIRWMLHAKTAPKSALIGGRRMFRESDLEDYINQAFDAAA